MRERHLLGILLAVQRLTHLTIENCRELFMAGRLFNDQTTAGSDDVGDDPDANTNNAAIVAACRSIEHLTIANNRYLSDALFDRLLRRMPALRSLSLRDCQIGFLTALYHKFYPAGRPLQPSESVLTFQFVARHICAPSVGARLTHLDFSATAIDAAALAQLAECAELRLHGLRLERCAQLTEAALLALADQQPQLRELNVSHVPRVTDAVLAAICRRMGGLRELRVAGCARVSDAGVRWLHRLRGLRTLDVSECGGLVSAAGWALAIGGVERGELRELHMRGLAELSEEQVARTARLCPALCVWDLSGCAAGVTDGAMQWVCRYAVRLRELSVRQCPRLSAAGLVGEVGGAAQRWAERYERQWAAADELYAQVVAQRAALRRPAPPPHVFDMGVWYACSEDGSDEAEELKRWLALCAAPSPFELPDPTAQACVDCAPSYADGAFEAFASLQHLAGLRSLDLNGCRAVDGGQLLLAVERAAMCLPELRTLRMGTIKWSPPVATSAAGAVAQSIGSVLGRFAPAVEWLDVAECPTLTDADVAAIAQQLRRLRRLNVGGCQLLSERALDALATHCERLQWLRVSGCRSIREDPYERLGDGRLARRCRIEHSQPGPYVQAPPAPPEQPWSYFE